MQLSTCFIRANDQVCDFDNHVPAPYFRKSFVLEELPAQSELTLCGLGFYELWINGKKITKGPLAPYISYTHDICYYDCYDLKPYLQIGENVIGVMLGNGFRNAFGGFMWDFEKAEGRGPVCLAFCLEYTINGKLTVMEADETVRTHPSPVTFDDLRMGCRYDARKELPGWNQPGYDDSSWAFAEPCETPNGTPRLCSVAPIVTLQEIRPVSVTHFDSLCHSHESTKWDAKPLETTRLHNVYVFDFGVDTAGVTRLHIKGEAGQRITVRHVEYAVEAGVTDNTIHFDQPAGVIDVYRDYAQVDVYTCRGGDEVFTPFFKYDGFRYAIVEGLHPDQVTEDTLVFLEQSSAMEERAGFTSSDPVLNRLQEMVRRSDRSNFFYFPTDCPHREKNGWTGDASVSAEHMLLNLTASPHLKEWLANIRAAQRTDGNLPGIVPTGGWGFEWGNGPAWDAVCVNLPYYIYKFDGDLEAIRENRDMILRYFEYAKTRLNEKGLADFGLGDWVDPFQFETGEVASPLAFTSSAQLFDIAHKAAVLFEKIGDSLAAEKAVAFREQMRTAIRRELIDPETLLVAGNCQTSQAVALGMGLFTPEETEAAGKRLAEIVRRDGVINKCGMIGLRYLFHALTAIGESDLAYRITVSDTFSCYGYWVANGSTTMWESFPAKERGASSHNHHFLGDISSWMIQDIAGLRPNPHLKGLDTYEIAPHFPEGLADAAAYYDTYAGRITCRWERQGDVVTLTVTAPDSLKGRLVLSDGWAVEGAVPVSPVGTFVLKKSK